MRKLPIVNLGAKNMNYFNAKWIPFMPFLAFVVVQKIHLSMSFQIISYRSLKNQGAISMEKKAVNNLGEEKRVQNLSLISIVENMRIKSNSQTLPKELEEFCEAQNNGEKLTVNEVNSVIKTLGKAKQWKAAVAVFHEILNASGEKPNAETYANTIRACVKSKQGQEAVSLYEKMDPSIEKNLDVFKAALEAFKATGQSNYAVQVLSEAEERGVFLDLAAHTNAMEACLKGQKPQDVLQIFDSMAAKNIQPDVISIGPVLKAYAKLGDAKGATDALESLKSSGQRVDTIAYNTVLNQFGVRLGKWKESLDLLNKMQKEGPEPDIESYNFVMKACGKAEKWDEVVNFFWQLSNPLNPAANWKSYHIALKAAQKAKRWEDALTIFGSLVDGNDTMEPEAYSIALQAIEKTGKGWHKALTVFQQIPCPTPGDYAVVIRCCNQFGEFPKAIELFELAKDDKEMPLSSNLYAAAMQTQIQMKQSDKVIELFEELRGNGISPSSKVYAMVLSEMKNIGDGLKALQLLKMMSRDGLSPTLMQYSNALEACYRSQLWLQSLQILNEMRRQNVKRDLVVYTIVLKTCVEARQGEKAVEVFQQIRDDGLTPSKTSYQFCLKALVYCKMWDEVIGLLDEMKQIDKSIVDMKLYSSIINSCAEIGWADQCLEILSMMKEEGIEPDNLINAAVMKTCMKEGQSDKVSALFDEILLKNQEDFGQGMYQSALQAAASMSEWNTVEDLLSKMESQNIRPDGKTLSWVIRSLANDGMEKEALNLYEKLKKMGWNDSYTTAEVIVILGHLERFDEAKNMFEKLEETGRVSSIEAYNIILHYYRDKGSWQDCIDTLKRILKKEMKPDHTSFALSIEACLKDQPPQIKRALSLMDIMYNSKLQPRVSDYNHILSSLFSMSKWPTVISVFGDMLKQKIDGNGETLSYVIQAYGVNGRLEKAASTYLKAQRSGVKFNTSERRAILESLVLSSLACRKYEQVLMFLEEMQKYSLSLDDLLMTVNQSIKVEISQNKSSLKYNPSLNELISYVERHMGHKTLH